MNLGYIGLAVSFIMLASVFLIIVFKANVNKWVHVALISVLIWYGLLLYSIPNNFAGWSRKEEPPDKMIILSVWVEEPSSKAEGGFYFWGLKYPEKEQVLKFSLDPQGFITYINTSTPRSYKIPYDKDMHKAWIEAQKQQREKGGIMMYHRGKGKPGEGQQGRDGKPGKGRPGHGNEQEDNSGFRLIHPQDLLPKTQPSPEV